MYIQERMPEFQVWMICLQRVPISLLISSTTTRTNVVSSQTRKGHYFMLFMKLQNYNLYLMMAMNKLWRFYIYALHISILRSDDYLNDYIYWVISYNILTVKLGCCRTLIFKLLPDSLCSQATSWIFLTQTWFAFWEKCSNLLYLT